MMENSGIIARRPAKDSQFAGIRQGDKDCLSVSVAFGWPNEKVYAMFHPEFIGEHGRLTKDGKRQCAQFFAYARHREYMDAYRETLAGSAGRKSKPDGEELVIDDSRKERALKQLLNKAMLLVDGGTELDADTIKVCSDIFTKLGLIKGEEEREIKPVRVLPVLCKSECRYRKFCETAKAEGMVFDDCDYCRARKFAEAHGFAYDPCTVLDLPEDVIAEIDSHNDVRLLDILAGKVEN